MASTLVCLEDLGCGGGLWGRGMNGVLGQDCGESAVPC